MTYPGLPANLYEAVAAHARHAGDRLAVEDDSGNSMTYRMLLHTADRMAYALSNRYGVKKGSHVAFLMYAGAEFVAAFLAVVKLGAIAVMLPTKYRAAEIQNLAAQADLNCILCHNDFQSYFTSYEENGIPVLTYADSSGSFGFSDILPETCPPALSAGGPEDCSIMMFTSGTTSLCKGVMIANYAYLHAVASYQHVFHITKDDTTVIPVPIYMITGLSALLGLMLFAGGTVYLQKFFHAKNVLRCIEEKRITFLHTAPTVYAMLAEERTEFPRLDSLRCLACGGSWTSRQLIERIHDWLPHASFHTVYGMTETASPATILPEDAYTSRHGDSNGIPIPGMQMKIVDDHGRELPDGQVGEILMRGTNLLSGYYKKPLPFADGWFPTGDVGYFAKDGYCYVVDRVKDMINRGGEKIVSSDVEKELLAIEGIQAAVVVGIPHAVYGEAPAAMVQLAEGSALDETVIRAFLKRRMAGYKIPEHFLFVLEIPLTANNKYDKRKIQTMFSAAASRKQDPTDAVGCSEHSRS